MTTKNEILDYMRKAAYRPLTEEELLDVFAIKTRGLRKFQALLREMELEGLVYVTRAARYGLPEKMNLEVGRLQGNAKGFGFVIAEKPDLSDVYVSAANMNGAMHNDRVVVRLVPGRIGSARRREGEVVKVLQRGNPTLSGTLHRTKGAGYVVLDEKRVPYDVVVNSGKLGAAKNGDKVIVEITDWPSARRGPSGNVVEVLGREGDPGVDILALCRRYGLPDEFPPKVQQEAEAVPAEISPANLDGREDLRDWTIFTIDGDDAKDLDDAVSLIRVRPHLFRLGVHIADVSYYVREGSFLDREAAQRGTSFYLPDRVIPMLPQRLSNGICSLHPRVDRLTMSVTMDINGNGEIVDYRVFPSVIRTVERMTYTNVRRILRDEDEELIRRYKAMVPTLKDMEELALILRERRFRRGAIDFNLPEAKVILDDEGRVSEIRRVERSIAEQMIEEFMLITNETVARHFFRLEVPFLYRVHEKPDEEKLASLQALLQTMGYAIPGFPKVRPGALQSVLAQVVGRTEERMINAVTLRSMKQARYSPDHAGHYGLAAKDYSHFTSPIRRYPDLMIHRIIREVLTTGALDPQRVQQLQAGLPETAKHSSEQERLAMEAEREAVDIKKVQFMQDKLGEEFNGFISVVTSFGIFVELENTVEGLITMTNLTDDYYEYEEKNYRLVGQRTRRIFRLGDPIRIKVARANTEDRKVEFVPVNGAEVITPGAQRRTVQRQEAVTPRKKETGRRAKSKSRTTPKSRQETKQRDRRKRGER